MYNQTIVQYKMSLSPQVSGYLIVSVVAAGLMFLLVTHFLGKRQLRRSQMNPNSPYRSFAKWELQQVQNTLTLQQRGEKVTCILYCSKPCFFSQMSKVIKAKKSVPTKQRWSMDDCIRCPMVSCFTFFGFLAFSDSLS